MEITCNKCGRQRDKHTRDLDYLNPDTVDLADNGIVFDFTHVLRTLDEEGDECGHEFDINVPVNVTEWVHVNRGM